MITSSSAFQAAHPQCASEIFVKVDRRLWVEIEQHFPISGVHHRTATANHACRLILIAFILSALRDDDVCFSFNQSVLDHMSMVGSRKRKKLVEYFYQSRFSRLEVNYSTDHHSIIRRLSGARIHRSPWYQQNIIAGASGVASPLLSLPAQWEYAGDTVTVVLSVEWFRRFGASYRAACSKLFQTQWQYVRCIESSISRCVISQPTFQDCQNLSMQKPRAAECSKPEDLAGIWRDMWAEWQREPLSYLFRVAGRCYYPLVNQPKALRRRYLKFCHNGQIEDVAEVDMGATYWVLLANMLDWSPCREMLIQDLAEGNFYERLNSESGYPFDDRKDLKSAVQKHCLFGRRNFGQTRLFATMERLYPDLARLIRYCRSKHPVRWLSDKLTNAEGEFFVDNVLPFVVNAGIPALPIHDALLVPASMADQVRRWCCDLAYARFGFEPRFKTTYGAAA